MQALQSRPLDLNILPAQYQPRRITPYMVAVVVTIVLALLGLVPSFNVLTATQAQTTELEARLSQARMTLAQTQAERAHVEGQIAQIDQQITQSQAEIGRLQAELNALSQRRTSRSTSIAAAITSLVPRIRITAILQEGNTLILTGRAGSQGLVLDYARALQANATFGNARILSMVNTDPLGLVPDLEFTIEVE